MKKLTLITSVSLIALNSAFANEPVWDGNTVELESQELADGVFAVIPVGAQELAEDGMPVATTGGFVIGDEGVLAVESMLNERLYDQFMALVAAETDLPVRYLVNTSHHGDHSYGNQYLPADVDIIQHIHTAEFIDEHLEADKAFMIQNFGEGRGIEEIVETDGHILVEEMGAIEVDLGGKVVAIRDYGFAQTGGDLFVSVPEADVLWTGNAIVAQAPALPWLLDGHLVDTRNTLQAVYDDFDADTRVVPGHGPVTDMDAVKWGIDYLTEVETQVQMAVDEGLTLEETTAKVTMADYQGYALFGWVHPGMNVPAAYAELSK